MCIVYSSKPIKWIDCYDCSATRNIQYMIWINKGKLDSSKLDFSWSLSLKIEEVDLPQSTLIDVKVFWN